MVGQWISDGSSEIHISSDGTEVESVMTDESSWGNVFNAIWKEAEEGATTGTHYWKIHITNLAPNSSAFVGFTDLDKFKKGWAMKGLLYGGNLSNGSALVLGDFGPSIKSGNTVGMLAVFDKEKLKMWFDLDGEPLGQAFDLPESTLSGIFPCVHFSGPAKATIAKSDEIPTELNRREPVYEGIEGNWKCLEFKGATPTTEVTLGIFKKEGGAAGFDVSLHVQNHIHYGIRHDACIGKWVAYGGISTRMGGPPELMKLEHDMKDLFANPGKVKLEEGLLVATSTSAATSKWQRYSIAKGPVTESPFAEEN